VKHIGIVACSAEGAALCYQSICREALAVVGKNDHPRITLDSIALARWLPAFDAGDHEGVARVMLESVRLLASAGADFAICPDNSAHLAWDHVVAATPIPWLHIARVVAEEARRRGFRRLRSPHFAISESPAFVGRAVAALAQDANVSRWNGKSLSSGQLAKIYGFTDLDGSQPDAWR